MGDFIGTGEGVKRYWKLLLLKNYLKKIKIGMWL